VLFQGKKIGSLLIENVVVHMDYFNMNAKPVYDEDL